MGSTRDVAKFAGGVALLGIFWDAAVGHALTWENDPYWTYWVTKTFLIATVFALGTALVGAGVGRGAAITAVHTLVLTAYYWTFSPIGLPANPTWLDLEHTWVTGLPIHFGVIYLGYLTTLWLWRRRDAAETRAPAREALAALAAAVAIVVLAGGGASLALGEWPGATYFLVRLLITLPFLLLWWSYAGRDWQANVGGAVVLAFVWASYGEFLGPIGLPDAPLRVLEEAPPPADVHWLDYEDQWLVSLPIYAVASALVTIVAGPLLPATGAGRLAEVRRGLPAAGAVLAGLVVPLAAASAWIEDGGDTASVAAAGAASVERGGWFGERTEPARARLSVAAEDRVRRVTPLPPHDRVAVSARIQHPDGRTYAVVADRPMVEHPAGRHGTWSGVGLDVWHHGDSGIGSDELPPTRSEVAVFALGDVTADGVPVARGVPVHVMTLHRGDARRVELQVGDPATPLPALPDGHLRVSWSAFAGGADRDSHAARYAAGSTVLLLLIGLALAAAHVAARGRSVP